MTTFIIETACSTTAEAHQLGEGITCALEGARVIWAYSRTIDGALCMVVHIEVPEEHGGYVCDLLDEDDRVVAYS